MFRAFSGQHLKEIVGEVALLRPCDGLRRAGGPRERVARLAD
jgi:hypothetical protein